MDVKIAGYNVSKELLDDYKELLDKLKNDKNFKTLDPSLTKFAEKLSEEEPTPEVISAAYARISRDPRVISELLAESREELDKARKSNRTIVFGLGHHSVAEPVKLNFNIVELSRKTIEALEERRIGSAYTEKSQRYITLDGDFIRPKEFNSQEMKKFEKLVDEQVNFYNRNIDKLIDYHFQNNPETAKIAREKQEKGISNKMNRELNKLEGLGKEDARYSLSMATLGQIGTSFNARTLEHTIRTLRHSKIAEERDLAKQLFDQAKEIVPSLIILADPVEFEKQFKTPLQDNNYQFTRKNLKEVADRVLTSQRSSSVLKIDPIGSEDLDYAKKGNTLLLREGDPDMDVTAAILFKNSKLTMPESYSAAENILLQDRGGDFFKAALKNISGFDALPREFEFANFRYSTVISSSNFAQMKRHRIMTLLPQDYDPSLGYTIPESVSETGLEKELKELYEKSDSLFEKFHSRHGTAADYLLTNGHRRKVAINVNARELYHLARLRLDSHAQWDIRKTASEMVDLAKEVAPLTFMLACEKDKFEETREKLYTEVF